MNTSDPLLARLKTFFVGTRVAKFQPRVRLSPFIADWFMSAKVPETLAPKKRLRKDNIGLREVTSSGYSSEQPRSEIQLYQKLTCIHSLLVVMADDVDEIKTSNVC